MLEPVELASHSNALSRLSLFLFSDVSIDRLSSALSLDGKRKSASSDCTQLKAVGKAQVRMRTEDAPMVAHLCLRSVLTFENFLRFQLNVLQQ